MCRRASVRLALGEGGWVSRWEGGMNTLSGSQRGCEQYIEWQRPGSLKRLCMAAGLEPLRLGSPQRVKEVAARSTRSLVGASSGNRVSRPCYSRIRWPGADWHQLDTVPGPTKNGGEAGGEEGAQPARALSSLLSMARPALRGSGIRRDSTLSRNLKPSANGARRWRRLRAHPRCRHPPSRAPAFIEFEG